MYTLYALYTPPVLCTVFVICAPMELLPNEVVPYKNCLSINIFVKRSFYRAKGLFNFKKSHVGSLRVEVASTTLLSIGQHLPKLFVMYLFQHTETL